MVQNFLFFKNINNLLTQDFPDGHCPVLWKDLQIFFQQEALNLPEGLLVDGTFGRGGHTSLLLNIFSTHKLLAFDRDPEAFLWAKKEGFLENPRFSFAQKSFSSLRETLETFQENPSCSLIFLDLGVSSPQLDQGHRGFSFQKSGPLDMRMNPEQKLTAAHIVNTFSEEALANIFYYYGEERHSRFFARFIKENGPFYDTLVFAQSLEKAYHGKYGQYKKKGAPYIHPATRIFQSLRIAVNNELEELRVVLKDGMDLLAPGGLFVVISFHSLEDSLVKEAFRQGSGLCSRKPLMAKEEEIQQNPRSRSAKWRWFRKQ